MVLKDICIFIYSHVCTYYIKDIRVTLEKAHHMKPTKLLDFLSYSLGIKNNSAVSGLYDPHPPFVVAGTSLAL